MIDLFCVWTQRIYKAFAKKSWNRYVGFRIYLVYVLYHVDYKDTISPKATFQKRNYNNLSKYKTLWFHYALSVMYDYININYKRHFWNYGKLPGV